MHKKIVVLLIILLTISAKYTFGQFISSYGLHFGFTSSWQTEIFVGGKLEGINSTNSFSGGLYVECFKGSWYSIKSEVNYSRKGMKMETPITTVEFPNGTGEILKNELQLDYLSLLIIPSIYAELRTIKIYALAGPRIDVELSKSKNISGPEPARSYFVDGIEKQLKNYKKIQYGLTIGVGVQIKELLSFPFGLEVRYNPDISRVYETEYIYIRNNSLEFLFSMEF